MDPTTLQQTLAAAVTHHQANRLADAEALYRQVLAVNPANADALHLLGVIAVQVGKFDAGAALIRRAVELTPASASVHYNLGCALQGMGELEPAKTEFQRALELQPAYPEAWNNLGDAQRNQRNYPEAERCFREALVLRSDFADAWTNLGTVLNRTARQMDAVAAHRRAIELRPNFAIAHSNLGNALMDLGYVSDALASFDKAITLSPQHGSILSNRLLTGFYDPARDIAHHAALHREWGKRITHGRDSRRPPRQPLGDPPRPLRIGYVSPDFYDHSVSVFFEPLLANHDPAVVDTFCYANVLCPDAVTARLQSAAHQWRDISSLTDEAAAQKIVDDHIDILVDLAGHTAANRLGLFARRLAPIQIAYLGYLGSTGLPTIDFRLTDAVVDPPGLGDELYTEQLYRLPVLACYRAPLHAPEIAPPPALANGFITFGCTNMLYKVSEQAIRCWADILRRVPTSMFRMTTKGLESPFARERIAAIFSSEGIDSTRITYIGKQPLPQYLAAHADVDLLLDTFPINGHTVACHALWMGVPMITFAGNSYPERLGASVLSAFGLGEFVTRSAAEYADVAVRLANDLPRLTALRCTLRERMLASPLMQEVDFARSIEGAYREMWRRTATTASP